MPAPPVTIYVTSLTSQAKVRKNIELLHRALRGFEIPYETFDLVMDEDAKRRWQRAKPPGVVVGLPGYLVGGEYIGDMDDFEYAVESGTLEAFLKQDMDHADASQTIGEAELDRLMREMTDADLDQLVGDLHVKEPSAASAEATSATAEKSAAATGAAATSATASPVKSVSAASPVKATSATSPVKFTSNPTSQPASAVSEAHASPTEAVSAATQAALSSPSGSPTTSPTTSQPKAASPTTPATASPSAPPNPTTEPASPPTTTAEPTGVLGALVSAATAVSDTAAKLAHNVEETAAHATDAAKDAVDAVGHNEGPAPGEKTLDDVIDETMAKEKAQAEAEDKDKAD